MENAKYNGALAEVDDIASYIDWDHRFSHLHAHKKYDPPPKLTEKGSRKSLCSTYSKQDEVSRAEKYSRAVVDKMK